MTTRSFSIRALLALVGVAGIGTALFVKANWLALFLAFNILVVTYLATAVISLVGPKRSRAFAVGFSVFGVGYLLIASSTYSRDFLYTNVLLDYAFDQIFIRQTPSQPPLLPVIPTSNIQTAVATTPLQMPPQIPPPVVAAPQVVFPIAVPPVRATPPASRWGLARWEPFIRIGHCLFSLLFAFAGGAFATYVSANDDRDTSPLKTDEIPGAPPT